MVNSDQRDEEYWRERLSSDDFRICREKGTERAFTGKYLENKETGRYLCKCCAAELFSSSAKYDSGSGWPSFYEGVNPENIKEESDNTHGMMRTEIMCNACGSHLGHVFPDGPNPTGLRYCVNSASLTFNKED